MESILHQISRRDPLITQDCEHQLWGLLEAVLGEERTLRVRASMRTLLLRVLELTLLGDPLFVDIARYPQSYLGDAHQIIHDRLQDLFPGEEIPRPLVEHLRGSLLSGVGVQAMKAATTANVEAVILRALARSTARDLRCEICGYHFVADDLGSVRRAIADRHDARLADYRLPARIRDTWKPASLSELTIDHVVPEAALGPTVDANLQVACKFCNSSKQIYRWPGESLSRDNAGSLSLLVAGPRMTWAVNASVFTTIITDRKCIGCNRSPLEVELTARRIGGGRGPGSLAPWSLEAVCYECFDPAA
jgi:hypothetical protein